MVRHSQKVTNVGLSLQTFTLPVYFVDECKNEFSDVDEEEFQKYMSVSKDEKQNKSYNYVSSIQKWSCLTQSKIMFLMIALLK